MVAKKKTSKKVQKSIVRIPKGSMSCSSVCVEWGDIN
jgi:hypothetical protein